VGGGRVRAAGVGTGAGAAVVGAWVAGTGRAKATGTRRAVAVYDSGCSSAAAQLAHA
jgi:hypothetical protein